MQFFLSRTLNTLLKLLYEFVSLKRMCELLCLQLRFLRFNAPRHPPILKILPARLGES